MQEGSYPSLLPTLSPRNPLQSPPKREVPMEWRDPTTLQLPKLMGSPVDQEGTLQTPPPPRPPSTTSPSPSCPRRSWPTPWRPRLPPAPPNPPGLTRLGLGSTTSRAPRPVRRHQGWRQQQTNKM